VAADTEHRGSAAQLESGRNVRAVWRRVPREVSHTECRGFGLAAVVVRQVQMGSHPRQVARNVQGAIGT
jgi:hypothetical protein